MDNNKSTSSDSSAVLGELKETIRRQAAEIATLKAFAATHPNGSSHNGIPSIGTAELSSAYLNSPFYTLAFRRVGWLSLFLTSLSLTAVIMNGFEHTLKRQIELAYFVPLLAGHGGNTGGQTVGTVLSALSSRSIQRADALAVILKEALSGLTVGLILGGIVGSTAHYMGGISSHVATVLFCTLPLLSTIAATLASAIPFLCLAVGFDPALIAAPAMTTLVDVSGLLSYFLIANQIFRLYGLDL